MSRSVLYVGPNAGTVVHRARALAALGHRVTYIEAGEPCITYLSYQLYRLLNRIRPAPDIYGANRKLRRLARPGIDLLWIDKGVTIRASTLKAVRQQLPDVRMVSSSPDDMMNPANQSRAYLEGIPLYDLHVTTKSYNVAELRQAGARDVVFVDNAYDPSTHRPLKLSLADRTEFGAEVGFVGDFEKERAEMMLGLASAGLAVTVRGPGWSRLRGVNPNLTLHDVWLDDLDYPKSLNATRINLGFLRKANRDLQTTRSVEIPACRAFLLAERTDEHLGLFTEGVEAEFFDGPEELLAKCRHYLAHDDERRRIAEAGFARCLRGGYDNKGRLRRVLDHLYGPPA